jgi:mono/diheme cytochrome c family protein
MVSALLVAVCALSMMGSFEWIREAGRRPYVVNEYRYSNGIALSDVADLNQGFLNRSKWSAVSEVTHENLAQAGEELFKFQCYACHTLDGVNNDIRSRTATSTFNGMVKYLDKIHDRRPFMPPFIGTEMEKKALAAYLVGTLHGKEVEIDAPQGENVGQQILDSECTCCHGADIVKEWAHEMTLDQVKQGLLSLSSINDSMEDYAGSAEELEALACFILGVPLPGGGNPGSGC